MPSGAGTGAAAVFATVGSNDGAAVDPLAALFTSSGWR
jgi:hypothetical protein